MKQKVMNIRPQEVTTGGERSVRYKGSDGKMHDFSVKLPQDAVIPVVHRTVIAAGETITLAQAHTIEGFDFNKVSALSFGEGYNSYSGFYVNVDDNGERYLTYLEYAYPGKPRVMFNKEGSEYTAFNGSSYNTFLEFSSNDIEASQSAIAEALLEIAKQTGFLEIYKFTNNVFLPNFYEKVVLLTLAEEIVTKEEFFVESFTGDLLKLPIGGDSNAPSNIVLEVNFADDGKAFTADELTAMITEIMAGKTLVCISDNNWGTQNERRIATLARVRGFEMADGVITLGDTLTFEMSKPSNFGDLDTVMFLKQNDGSYELSHYFNK